MRKALEIAGEICIYTNRNIDVVEVGVIARELEHAMPPEQTGVLSWAVMNGAGKTTLVNAVSLADILRGHDGL